MKNSNQLNISIAELIQPWDSLEQLLQVIHVYNSMKHYEKHDISIIAKCIEFITKKLITNNELQHFIDKIKFNKTHYPLNFIQNLDSVDKSISNYINTNGYATREFKTNRSKCASCQQSFDHETITYTHKTAVAYYITRPPETVFNTYLKCTQCQTDHYHSYYINSSKQKFFYPECFNMQFISFTNRTIFEKQIFDIFLANLHFQHTSFKSYCDTYNSLYTSKIIKRNQLSRKKFTECWLYYNLLLYHHEYYDITKFIAPIIEELDKSLKSIRNNLFQNFVKKWSGEYHTKSCKHPNCSKILNTDGIWKNTRDKCGHEEIYLNSEEVKPIKTGCKLTPKPNSYYCEKHEIPEPVTNIYINSEYHTYRIKSIKEASPFHRSRKIKKIHDSFYCEPDLKRKITKENSKQLDTIVDHDNDNEENVLYLVESEVEYLDSFYWLKKQYLPIDIYSEFIKELNARENLDIYDEISCNTNKHFCTPYTKKSRTKGLLISAYNCGIVNGYRELYGSESISQVTLYYLDIISSAQQQPEIFLYDDACHLRKYIEKRDFTNKSKRASVLQNKQHFIDKFHIHNHVDPWCLKNCNPQNIEELNAINTVVCEQINYWLGGFKHTLKHMNYERFHFFLFIILNNYNNEKLKHLNKINQQLQLSKSNEIQKKR